MSFSMYWPTQFGVITQKFGVNPQVYNKFRLPGHEGVDFQAPTGSELYAVADGFVSDVRLDGNADPVNKPYGNQVRIQHAEGYESIYAHLSQAVVTRGQMVKKGQLIGLAGNTGHSFGAHLHFSLKRSGATTPGYPPGIIDPTPYLENFGSGKAAVKPAPPAQPTMQVVVDSAEVGYLNLRDAPYANAALIVQIPHNTTLGALEDEATTRSKIGQNGQWLWVRTPDRKEGYVAAWYLKLPTGATAPATPATVLFVTVASGDTPLKLRSGPTVNDAIRAEMPDGTQLKVLEPEAQARGKVGQQGQWLNVQAPNGAQGYVAAWYVKLEAATGGPIVPQPVVNKATKYVIVESPEFGLRVRERGDVNAPEVWRVPHKTVLESLEDPNTTGRKIAQQGQWIRVRTPAHHEGYVAAWFVRPPNTEDTRQAANASTLPKALSPHIFGIHAVTLGDDPHTKDAIRSLYNGKNKKGWVFFTETCGAHPQNLGPSQEVRNRLWEWVSQGYGVIVRLNNGYEPGGTLPESNTYDGFAEAAAKWCDLYLKRPELGQDDYAWTIQIANEQNNPREHPGGFEHPREHISPELYARAFNKAYAKIKAVLPNAIVCPGAVDPYNYMPWRKLGPGDPPYSPLQYYEKMLAHIDQLDGIILHAYIHGPDPRRVTSLERFANGTGPLWDHYFDFKTYTVFMERIPDKWRDVPVYITEMNHICRASGAPLCERDQGWENANTGVVRAMYQEIDRWNRQPYAQQIRCGLLYRWFGDQWALNDKGGVLEDFKQALDNDFRWRTVPMGLGDFSFGIMAEAVEAAAPEPIEERGALQPDNLQKIWGIGPKTEQALHTCGIYIFEQLAALDAATVRALLSEIGARSRYLGSWGEQARLIVAGDAEGLAEVQAGLGRKSSS